MRRGSALLLTNLSPVNLDSQKQNAGIRERDTSDKANRKGKKVADCFKAETVNVHKNKGGDGFEAWKGNRFVIKRNKLGIKKVEQRIVPRTGRFA